MSVNIDQGWDYQNFKKSPQNSVHYPSYSTPENINFHGINILRYGGCQVRELHGLHQTAFSEPQNRATRSRRA